MMVPRSISRAAALTRSLVTSECSGASNFTLLTATQAAELEPLMARDLTLRVLGDDEAIRALQIIIVRAASGEVRGYENNCPHQGGPLNAQPGSSIFSRRHPEHLMCSRHGARFSCDDGYCVSGPCAGHGLHAVPLDATANGVTITIADARSASRFGRLLLGTPDESTLSPSSPVEVVRPAAFPIVDAARVFAPAPTSPPAAMTPTDVEDAGQRRPPPLAPVPEHVLQRMRQWEITDARLGD